jgi:hypothetical protein
VLRLRCLRLAARLSRLVLLHKRLVLPTLLLFSHSLVCSVLGRCCLECFEMTVDTINVRGEVKFTHFQFISERRSGCIEHVYMSR